MGIWDGTTIGRLRLPHRLALAPMTRSRAESDGSPNALMADYYAQRASLGLLISEGAQPSADGQGFPNSPGIYTDAHVRGWRSVSDAVHAAGGHLFIQLMHVGRIAHPDNHTTGGQSVAPSAIAFGHPVYTDNGMQMPPAPRALSTAEVREVQEEFADAAERAIEAGADGVELHAANGYIFWQFLHEQANQRTDEYGGTLENRVRFTVETAKLVAERIGADRVGIRLSPGASFNGLDEGPRYRETYLHLLRELHGLGLAYIHLFHFSDDALLTQIRRTTSTPLLLVRAGRTYADIEQDITAGLADVFPIGTDAIANPDLVERLQAGIALTPPASPATFYGGGAAGYTDFPRATPARPGVTAQVPA